MGQEQVLPEPANPEGDGLATLAEVSAILQDYFPGDIASPTAKRSKITIIRAVDHHANDDIVSAALAV